MRRLPLALSAMALGSTMLLVPGTAHAAGTQVGSSCLAQNDVPNTTFVLTGVAGGTVVTPAGVITKATFNVPNAAPPLLPQVLKVMRPTGTADQYLAVSQSASIPVANTLATYDVRLPVTAGDHIGLYGGATGTLICTGLAAGDSISVFAGDVAVGASQTFSPPSTGVSMPLVVTVEPDADGDGYGDLSQDLCPQSASAQTACPVVKLDAVAASSGKSISAFVTSSTSTTVTVTGEAKVNGKKLKLKGGSKAVDPGALTKFTVKIPSALKAALAKLPASKSIKVTITSTAKNAAGQVTTDKTKVKLPGTK